MNKFLITLFLSFCITIAFAQQNHFVYLQTYNNQPFYLRMDTKVLSSSATGYLIIPKLTDGYYKLIIGFAKNQFPEQIFNINVKGNTGFELKNFGDQGWGLFDLQTAQVTMGSISQTPVAVTTAPVPKKTDAFADMLSSVVKDSSIRVDDSSAFKNNATPRSVQEEKVFIADAASSKITEPVMLYTEVKRTSANNITGGKEIIYTDNNGKKIDTIRIFIAGENPVVITPEEPKPNNNIESLKADTSTAVVKTETVPAIKNNHDVSKPAPKFIEDTVAVKEVVKAAPSKEIVTKSSALPMINSDCHSIATEDDFLKLRKKMAAEKDDENMIRVAKKGLKLKCYNTGFIKNLSVLFLTDKGRYSFFDMAYPFVEDSANYPTLEKELSDTYYINRFKAMITK